jgi:hypothetical protein
MANFGQRPFDGFKGTRSFLLYILYNVLQDATERGNNLRSVQMDGPSCPVQTALEGILLTVGFIKPPSKEDLVDPEHLYKGQYFFAVTS